VKMKRDNEILLWKNIYIEELNEVLNQDEAI